MRHSAARVVVLVSALLGSVLAVEPAARAQRARNEAGPMVTPIARGAVDDYAAILSLDAEQKVLARSLYDGYRAAMRQAGKEADERLKAMDDAARDPDAESVRDFREHRARRLEVVREYVRRTGAVEREFYGDLKAVLTPDQAERFDAVERARRREAGMLFHLLSGEGVDLTRVVADLELAAPAPAELAPALDEYEAELDRLIRAKTASIQRLFEAAQKMEDGEPREEPGPPKAMIDALKEFHAECVKIRDANRTHARRISAILPEASRPGFTDTVRARSYPKIYKETAADRALGFARGLADLTPDQRAELDGLAESFQRDAATLNAKWAAALDAKHEKLVELFTQMFIGEEMNPEQDPLKLACDARRELDERVRDRITRLLTKTQIERLGEKKIEPSEFDPDWTPDFNEEDAWKDWDDEGDEGK